MKIHTTIDITRIDPESSKGEDFDQEFEDAINEINIDGWEIQDIKIERIKAQSSPLAHDFAKSILALAKPISIEGKDVSYEMDSKSPMNEDYTVREMLIYYAEELLKRKG